MSPRHQRFVIAFLAAFAVGLAGLAGFNIATDLDGLFDRDHGVEKGVARMLGAGRYVVTTGNFRAPLVNHLLIASWQQAPDVVAIGSSRILEVSADMAPGYRFFNHGGTSSKLPHMLAVLGGYENRGGPPATVLIGAEHWLFAPHRENAGQLTGAMTDLAVMLERLHTTPDRVGLVRESPVRIVKALLSGSLAYRGLIYLTAQETDRCNRIEARDDDRTPCPVKRRDGSFKYPQASEQATAAQVAERLKVELGRRGGLYLAEGIDRVDPAKVEAFEALLGYLRGRGSRVVLLLSPFHPLVSSAPKHARDWAKVRRIEDLIRAIAARNGIEVRGSFSAAQAGCGAEEFYDDVHPRHSCIARILDGALTGKPGT